MRQILLSLVATALVSTVAVAEGDASSAAPPVAQGSIPSGHVWLSGGSVAIGIGYSWGHGTLYNSKDQKEYKFKISGVSVADVGAAGIPAEGEVYNLTTPAAPAANTSAARAGAAT